MSKDVPEWKSQGHIVVLSSDVLGDDEGEKLSPKQRSRRQKEKEREYWKEFTDFYRTKGEHALREKASSLQDRVEKTKNHLESLRDRLQAIAEQEEGELYTSLYQSQRDTRKHLQFLHLRASVCRGVLWEIDRYGAPQWLENADENTGWTARDSTTERAVDVVSAYNEKADEVSKMKHLSKLLGSRGHGRDRSTRETLIDSARRHGVEWEDGDPHSFIRELANALDEADELPNHLQNLKTPQDSCG